MLKVESLHKQTYKKKQTRVRIVGSNIFNFPHEWWILEHQARQHLLCYNKQKKKKITWNIYTTIWQSLINQNSWETIAFRKRKLAMLAAIIRLEYLETSFYCISIQVNLKCYDIRNIHWPKNSSGYEESKATHSSPSFVRFWKYLYHMKWQLTGFRLNGHIMGQITHVILSQNWNWHLAMSCVRLY